MINHPCPSLKHTNTRLYRMTCTCTQIHTMSTQQGMGTCTCTHRYACLHRKRQRHVYYMYTQTPYMIHIHRNTQRPGYTSVSASLCCTHETDPEMSRLRNNNIGGEYISPRKKHGTQLGMNPEPSAY